MGGANQSTCPPPAKSSVPASSAGVQKNPIRSHESNGETHFHDDVDGFKCVVDAATFKAKYLPWRDKMMAEELRLCGTDGLGGRASVVLIPYVDDDGNLQVTTIAKKTSMGKTVLDLDQLAHYP